MSASMLTGRPAEEMPGSAGDLLPELSQLHEQIRQVMQGIAQALWPSASPPGGMGELIEKLKGARAALLIMEDISLPTRCKGSLGYGEDMIYQSGPKPHGRGQTYGA